MDARESMEFIRNNRLGILSLANGGHAYAVPLYYGFDGRALWFQTQPGLKIEFAQRTQEACFTIVRVTNLDAWASVQVFGPVERVGLDVPHASLMSVPLPPAWGETPRGEPRKREREVLVLKLTPQRVSGRYSENAPRTREEAEIAFGGM